ncbi:MULTISPECIES: 3-hydroxyacyl-CoA dehydrogenase NAD-binding domain-containing protein [unclassified Beijerinckia]|uniref:3-hydroxyacyl-CoA dehydrogenase NAD-binding domain-containing protein n=1 Tax=unclassified Beijerinckia TaxID=2638183 RepID=UPI00089729B6|nr:MULTISPECIES: 3-hydroxyacyl-CoA dehydrogenase NAD-binding domain-containing protein [unclassified Beijerinckia]MDH7794386.1 3-hydroxyacyl-CoA dehydrogenase [Beijerinckia sp. GAS462]SEB60653.1 short chain enoyl-CoA hydratase /3-hydroxyacyl-CoA dehydrogenase [Beijerinckia sp. 28-YEA-48]
MTAPVSVSTRNRIAIATIDNPPVNAASQAVRAGLKEAIERLGADSAVDAIVIACAGRTFVAGADIREFGKLPLSPILFEVTAAIEACPKPVIAAVHGTALGGGCEIALASHARVLRKDAKLGLPEVKLGVVPGAGGTQRLPRFTGVEKAMEIVSSGRMIDAKEAQTLGIADALTDGDVLEAAIDLAKSRVGTAPTRTSDRPVPAFDTEAAKRQLNEIERKARGQKSPREAASLVLAAPLVSVTDGVKLEREAFLRLTHSEQGMALRHIFFAERDAAKVDGLDGVAALPVTTVGIAGAGTMGAGIAVAFADAGYKVIVAERDMAAATAGKGRIDGIYARTVKSGRLSEAAAAERLSRIDVRDTLEALAPSDLIVEAVFDDLEVKRTLFKTLAKIVRPDAILATNTSYLDPELIADVTPGPDRVVGMHFFAPPNIMRLLEVVRCARTRPDVLATALALGKKLRKLPIVSGVCPGFIGNRIYAMYRRQCEYMLEEGATPRQIDEAMESFGLPMGPFRVFDMSGLDISWAQRKRLAPTRDPSERYVSIADRICEAGHFGQKTGAGWYLYENNERKEHAVVRDLIDQAAKARGLPQRQFSTEDIRIRLVAAMAKEGAQVLREGIAQRASDIDLVFVNGYGWPNWLGGPMFQADRIGAPRILAEIEAMQTRDGPGWEADAAITDAVRNGTPMFSP